MEDIEEFVQLNIPEEALHYDTDEEYQEVFLHFFKIDSEKEDYNEESIYEGLACILGKTQTPEWTDLYVKAAAEFLSEDPEIGLPVLLSYTYFPDFYRVFSSFIVHGSDEAFHTKIQELRKRFEKPREETEIQG